MASERSHANVGLASALNKPIPKEPPPPPVLTKPSEINNTQINSNGSHSKQAPALPPKPSNHFSPFLPQSKTSSALSLTHSFPPAQHRVAREQARVLYAYKPSNDDELEIEVGDIIDVLDKDIDDQGWWKGELNGKIGVFPDNFVQLITPQTPPTFAPQQPYINQQANSDSKMKSVFANIPHGFSKELENNLEKHTNSTNSTSSISLIRNKLQNQFSGRLNEDQLSLPSSVMEDKSNTETTSPVDTNGFKLNHITANRAKGPTRRPPSNVVNKRTIQPNDSSNKSEPEIKDETPRSSLVLNSLTQHTPRTPVANALDHPRMDQQVSELKSDVARLKAEVKGLEEIIGALRLEVKSCRESADSQKRYIRELVTNLADEKMKMATLREEMNRELN